MLFRVLRSSSAVPATTSIGVRAFSTSPVCEKLFAHVTSRRQKAVPAIVAGMSSKDLPKEIPEFPAYPYGPSQWFKRADKGLYGGQTIQFGNQISEFDNKSRRTWHPNVTRSTLWSETLRQDIKIKVTTRVLRTITKSGGIDNYLTKGTAARIKELGPTGWKLRYRVLSKIEARDKTAPKIIETLKVENDEVPIYFKYLSQKSGKELKIKVGKRKVLKELFEVLKRKDEDLSHFEFVKKYADEPADVLFETLETNKYDLTKISA